MGLPSGRVGLKFRADGAAGPVYAVDDNGQITAVSAGSATITAQASNRKSTMSAECIITVADPMNGYSISVQRTAVENYVYIYVQPEDDDVSQITSTQRPLPA